MSHIFPCSPEVPTRLHGKSVVGGKYEDFAPVIFKLLCPEYALCKTSE